MLIAEKIALTASHGINKVQEASLESVKSIKAIAEKISRKVIL